MTNVLNLVLYQTGWLACVLGAAWGAPWWGIAIAASTLAAHFLLAKDRRQQLRITLLSGLVGLLLDTTLLNAGVFQFSSGVLVDGLPPLWMTLLWIQFATTFRYCLSWLTPRLLLASAFGLLGAPLAFWAGERMGAIEFLEPRMWNFALLGVGWAVTTPLLFWLTGKLAADSSDAGYRGLSPSD